MDKRKYLGSRFYTNETGKRIEVKIYKKFNNRGMNVRVIYGEIEVYTSDYIKVEYIDDFVKKIIKKYQHIRIMDRPFMKEDVYCYILGKKRYFTTDSALKNDSNYFYIPTTTKDPIGKYKRMFLEYLKPRLLTLGKVMGKNLSDYRVRTGLFLTYYGAHFSTKKQFKFDYRLFSFKPDIIDTVIIHEIAHTYERKHDDRFYKIVHMFCPQYDRLQQFLNEGKFEGELDNYVF